VTEKPPPRCKAMLLCERTMVEAGTTKVTLIGLIAAHVMQQFPGRTPLMRTFLYLVDGIGEYDITVEVHDLADDRIIFRAKGRRISFPDRLASRLLFFSIPPLPILHPGRYDVVVLGNGKEIERQQFRALPVKKEGETE
jgi:hypothetical protein